MEPTFIVPVSLDRPDRADARWITGAAQRVGIELAVSETRTYCNNCLADHVGVGLLFESQLCGQAVFALLGAEDKYGRS